MIQHNAWRFAAVALVAASLSFSAKPSVAEEPVDERSLEQVVWAPDGIRIVAKNRRDLEIWNLETEAIERRFVGHTLEVAAFALTPDGASLVSVAKRDEYSHRPPEPRDLSDGTIRVWDGAAAQERRRIDYKPDVPFEDRVRTLAMHPQGDRFALATWNRVIQWGMDGTLHFRHETPDQPTNRCEYSPDGKSLLIRLERELRVLDARTGEIVRTLRDQPPGWHGGGRFVCGGKYVAGGTVDGKFSHPSLVVWDAETGEIVRRFENAGAGGYYDVIRVGGDRVAMLSSRTTGIRTWNLATMTPGGMIPIERVLEFELSSDGTRMLVQTYPLDNAEGDLSLDFISLWNLESNWEILRIPSRRHPDGDLWASFSPDGSKVLVQHGPIELLEAKTGASLRVFGQDRSNDQSGER